MAISTPLGLNFLDLLFSFSIDCFFGTLIALGEPILVKHPYWIAKMVRVFVVLVHNPDPFIESPHAIVHFEANLSLRRTWSWNDVLR